MASDLYNLIGSAADVINNGVMTASVATEYVNVNNRASSIYNTRAQEQADINKKIPELINSLSVSAAEKFPDFDTLAKKYDIQYGISHADFDDLISKFNLSKLPNYDAVPAPFVGHIIMTRPSLYVDTSDGYSSYSARSSVAETPDMGKNFAALKNHPKTAAYVNDAYGKKLLKMLSDTSSSYYMPIFTTYAASYSTADFQLKTVEKAKTYYGHSIKYAHYNEEHKFGGSMSIDFRNDRFFSILKAIYIWMSYIDIVSRGEVVKPSYINQMNGILDYCGSIYYLVTDMRMSKLIYWEKLTGVFPKSAPLSIFSYNDSPVIVDKVTVEFDYGIKSDPCDPNILFDLNMLSTGSYSMAAGYMQYGPGYQYGVSNINYSDINQVSAWSNTVRPDNYKRSYGISDALAAKPIIQAINTNGALNYYLHWLRA